jgi:hypothetical protein
MKKISVLLFGLLCAGHVFAQASGNSCTGAAASGDGTAVSPISGAASFVVKGFTPKCSSNVFASFEQNAVAFVVGSASSKGKNRFRGSTGGGGVAGESCSGVTCVVGDATSGLGTILASAT